MLEEENKTFREHRAGRKYAKSRTEREAIPQLPFEERQTDASAESFNAKIKAFRAQFRGVGFMFRLAMQYA